MKYQCIIYKGGNEIKLLFYLEKELEFITGLYFD